MRPRAPEWQAAAKTARGAFNLLDFGEKGEGGGGGDGSGDQGGVERKVAWDEGNEANMARKRAGSCRPAPRWSSTAKALLSACIGACAAAAAAPYCRVARRQDRQDRQNTAAPAHAAS